MAILLKVAREISARPGLKGKDGGSTCPKKIPIGRNE